MIKLTKYLLIGILFMSCSEVELTNQDMILGDWEYSSELVSRTLSFDQDSVEISERSLFGSVRMKLPYYLPADSLIMGTDVRCYLKKLTMTEFIAIEKGDESTYTR